MLIAWDGFRLWGMMIAAIALDISWPALGLVALALLGHWALYLALKNSLHARAIPHRALKKLDWLMRAHLIGLPLLIGFWYQRVATAGETNAALPWGLAFYVLVCLVTAVGPLPWFLLRRFRRRPLPVIRQRNSQELDLRPQLTDTSGQKAIGRILCAVPLNEAYRIELAELEVEVPRLPPALDGLVIAHITDFHMTGRVTRKYFELVADAVAEMCPDLIALTGDLVDKTPCLDWINATFGKLSAPHGVYYILGNHDERVDVAELRRRLAAAGLQNLGGRCQVIDIRGEQIVLIGNELPWFGPAGSVERCPEIAAARDAGRAEPFKLLLSHSPDQICWARERGIDLMLAGHTHGGQIRFPLIEATVCPSLYGVRYASGTFWESPTVMHVNRGISSEWPLRWRCPPEITRLQLRAPQQPSMRTIEIDTKQAVGAGQSST
ncbi:MAG: metallophosphoesterase [Planctomycetes bacterium]|nr:metallophosphoesterase [Planctomycetota bacterium]